MEATPREIRVYITPTGQCPYQAWLGNLRDFQAQKRIRFRIERLRAGNLGDCRFVGQGVYELRIDYGPGYRVYFGQRGSTFVLLLCGGDKRSQSQDILNAQAYWRQYGSDPNP